MTKEELQLYDKEGIFISKKTRGSRKHYLKYYILGIIIIIALIYTWINTGSVQQILLWTTILTLFTIIKFTELHRLLNHYEIQENALVHTEGLINKNIKLVSLKSVSDIYIKQNLWQQLLGYGDVHLSLFGNMTYVRNINNPHKFARHLQETVSQAKESIRE